MGTPRMVEEIRPQDDFIHARTKSDVMVGRATAAPDAMGRSIAGELMRAETLRRGGRRPDPRFDDALRALFDRFHLSWRGYRKVRRRLRAPLAARAAQLGLGGIEEYIDRAAADRAEVGRLNALVAISVSRFFRDREDWSHLARVAFPALRRAAGGGPVRALCLGCASGEEPYTLRMLWSAWAASDAGAAPSTAAAGSRPGGGGAASPRTDLVIVAADVRADLLERARGAVYPPSSITAVPPELRERHFRRDAGGFRLDPPTVRSVHLVRLDFYDGAIPGPVDLLLCRNSAFTYLAPERLRAVESRLRGSTRRGGYLMVGGREGCVEPAGFERSGRCLFRRRRRVRVDAAPVEATATGVPRHAREDDERCIARS